MFNNIHLFAFCHSRRLVGLCSFSVGMWPRNSFKKIFPSSEWIWGGKRWIELWLSGGRLWPCNPHSVKCHLCCILKVYRSKVCLSKVIRIAASVTVTSRVPQIRCLPLSAQPGPTRVKPNVNLCRIMSHGAYCVSLRWWVYPAHRRLV